MKKVYNKLVRDKIPKIIESNGGLPTTKILNDKEYKEALENKLFEEYNEVIKTTTSEKRIEELADMLELIKSLALLENKNLDDVIKVAEEKRKKRGGFENKIYLKTVIEEK